MIPKSVDSLRNFPFKTFADYKLAVAGGTAKGSIDSLAALTWGRTGPHCPPSLRRKAIAASAVVAVGVLLYIGFSILTGRWWLLLFLLIHFFLTSLWIASPAVRGLLALGLLGGAIMRSGPVIGLTAIPLLMAHTQLFVERFTAAAFGEALELHEDLFCAVWATGGLRVTTSDGTMYHSEFQVKDGKVVTH